METAEIFCTTAQSLAENAGETFTSDVIKSVLPKVEVPKEKDE